MATLTTEWQDLGSATLYSGISIHLDGRYTSQSIENNTTTVQFRLRSTGTQWRTTSGTASFTGQYTDSASCATYPDYITNGETIYSITKTITHNSDGTQSFAQGGKVKAVINSATRTATISNLGVYLPTIPRQATITSAPNFTDEENPTINYSNPIGNSASSLQACISLTGSTDDIVYRDISKTGTSYTFNLTTAERNVLRQATASSNTRNVKFFVKTVIGGNNYYNNVERTLTIVNANPDETTTFEETNVKVVNLLGSSSANTVVQNVSVVRIISTPTLLKYATLKQYQFINGNTVVYDNVSPYQADIVPTTNTFTTTIIDSRNNSKVNTYTKTMIDYIPVDIISYSFKRVNPTSDDIVLNATINYKQTTFDETANVPTIQWKVGEEGQLNTLSSSDYTIDTENNKITIYNLTLQDVLNYQSEARFYLYASDLLTEDTENFFVTKGIPTFDAGEHDFKVNGDLYIADTGGNNAVNVGKAIEKNIISVGITSPVRLTTLGQVIFTPNKIIQQIGNTNKLYLSTNGLYIGSDVNYIMLSGGMQAHTADTGSSGGAINMSIYKNGNECLLSMNSGRTLSTNFSRALAPQLISVDEGDYFQFGFYGQSGDYVNDNSERTYMTIEVVE